MLDKDTSEDLHSAPKTRLGASWDGKGVEFKIFSSHASHVELCLFDQAQDVESRCISMHCEQSIWSVYIEGVGPGQLYGFRVDGPWQPAKGHRFNKYKLLLDPYAKSIAGDVEWSSTVYPYCDNDVNAIDVSDNAVLVPKSIVIDTEFDWQGDKKPNVPMSDTLIYELHIKGFSKLNQQIDKEDRGTYMGLTAPAGIKYLKDLGVTTLELLPCAFSLTSKRLNNLGLTNYWGYDPLAWFAPDPRFAKSDAVSEFKQMVKLLHKEGFEVILDVVYNHTSEENILGPNLCFRGIDNLVYYRTRKDAPGIYEDYTGCGNTVNSDHPQVQQMIIDCLRYWVDEMHVDGFRFDLATTLMRKNGEYSINNKLFESIANDTVLSSVKMIAEPWDLGLGGYQLGNFPESWSEWNDKYRDAMRAFWRGDGNLLSEFSRRFLGSADIFSNSADSGSVNRVGKSINFISAHDGFTLRDTVSYERKHNLENGEDNRDGHNHNLSSNHGIEGETDDADINAVRLRKQLNLLSCLILSHGVPMLLAGDECNRSQRGNNNAYCQDNGITWINWQFGKTENTLLEFVKLLISLRKQHSVFRPVEAFAGDLLPHLGFRDVEWLRPDAKPMSRADWDAHFARFVGILLNSADKSENSFLIFVNAGVESINVLLPAAPNDGDWKIIFDTSKWPLRDFMPDSQRSFTMEQCSVCVLTQSDS